MVMLSRESSNQSDIPTLSLSHSQPSLISQRRRPRSSSTLKSNTTSPANSIITRQPSPIISFTPTAPHTHSAKGVKDITRKVIRRLEGLGHLEMIDGLSEAAPEENEVERMLQDSLMRYVNAIGAQTNTNGHAADAAHSKTQHIPNGKPSTKGKEVEKIDWEIPRKVLHSSIGFVTLYGYVAGHQPQRVMLVLWSALAIIVPLELIRLRSPKFERTYERCAGFLMRDSEKHSVNGVVWYILGVNFVLSLFPADIASVAILILSWADTAASTIGRLYGRASPRLPARLPVLRLPLAPRKSLAGFTAASITGACIAIGFLGYVAPLRNGGADISWAWGSGVRLGLTSPSQGSIAGWTGGWFGLGLIGVVAGLVSGVAEALDLGSLDDNLTLPIISGSCIFGFFKLLSFFSS